MTKLSIIFILISIYCFVGGILHYGGIATGYLEKIYEHPLTSPPVIYTISKSAPLWYQVSYHLFAVLTICGIVIFFWKVKTLED